MTTAEVESVIDKFIEAAKRAEIAGIDSIEVSGNGTSIRGIKAGVNEGYFAPFAIKLAEKVNVPVICVGGWRTAAA